MEPSKCYVGYLVQHRIRKFVKTTDMTILRALLDAGKKSLSIAEAKAFKSMLLDLEGGKYIRLSKSQREWAEKRYYGLQLDRVYRDTPPPPVVHVKPKTPIVYAWEQGKPFKPPGR